MFTYVWIALTVLTGGIAYWKGRGPIGWFLFAWAVSPALALPLVLWRSPDDTGLTRRRVRRGARKCPACASFVGRSARVCPTCQAALPALPNERTIPLVLPVRPATCLVCGDAALYARQRGPVFLCPMCHRSLVDYRTAVDQPICDACGAAGFPQDAAALGVCPQCGRWAARGAESHPLPTCRRCGASATPAEVARPSLACYVCGQRYEIGAGSEPAGATPWA
jgi:predicted RNA-binding Zn-ribbon protein involved in translation (DUF1610 family)